MISQTLNHILRNYLSAKDEVFTDHPIAEFIRHDAAQTINEALSTDNKNLITKGSPGQSKWADVPWIAVLDPVITNSATRGYYVVYLFSSDMKRVYLSLNQGTTAVKEEFKSKARDELLRRAALMRERLSGKNTRFLDQPIDLSSHLPLPLEYEAAHAFGVTYSAENLPSEVKLIEDLNLIITEYLMLTARGGLDPSIEYTDTGPILEVETIEEKRRYKLHRKIERNSKAAKTAKQVHGYICQACGFDFEKIYGPLGRNYIEAHHLTPLSELPEGKTVSQDPQTDFAVLCANCHRMIHRKSSPKRLSEFSEVGRLPELHAFWKKFNSIN